MREAHLLARPIGRPWPRPSLSVRGQGEIPEWSKGADCKSVGSAFEGSNPSLPTSLLSGSAAGAAWLPSKEGFFLSGRRCMSVDIDKHHFYKDGLRFECTRCSKCCRHTPGYVFLSEVDIARLAAALALTTQEFLLRYCHRVRFGPVQRVSLKEKPNIDCIFWDNGGCTVYEARPLQCRAYPFWSSCVSTPEEWRHHAGQCPGIGRGPLHSREEIEGWLDQRLKEPFVEA